MPEATHVGSGKVREIYALGEHELLLVASDRISTFDVVLPTEIPDKGRVLTGLSAYWFSRTREIVPNHLLAVRPDGRSLECRRLAMLPVEFVVRGYLAGSGWVEYRDTGTICGHPLAPGLVESERLPEPILTPATKAMEGHDLNITEAEASRLCGEGPYRAARAAALALYRFAAERAEARGLILADTKFELGLDAAGDVTLGDEALTPDSSRFWPADDYRARPATGVVRQAVRPRLVPGDGVGPDCAGAGPAGRRGRGDEGAVRRGVRADHRHRVRPVRRRSGGRAVRLTVLIRPKAGILDPQGEAVQASLSTLGFSVTRARVGRLVDLEIATDDAEAARTEVERMCAELLANPLIESFEVVVEDA